MKTNYSMKLDPKLQQSTLEEQESWQVNTRLEKLMFGPSARPLSKVVLKFKKNISLPNINPINPQRKNLFFRKGIEYYGYLAPNGRISIEHEPLVINVPGWDVGPKPVAASGQLCYEFQHKGEAHYEAYPEDPENPDLKLVPLKKCIKAQTYIKVSSIMYRRQLIKIVQAAAGGSSIADICTVLDCKRTTISGDKEKAFGSVQRKVGGKGGIGDFPAARTLKKGVKWVSVDLQGVPYGQVLRFLSDQVKVKFLVSTARTYGPPLYTKKNKWAIDLRKSTLTMTSALNDPIIKKYAQMDKGRGIYVKKDDSPGLGGDARAVVSLKFIIPILLSEMRPAYPFSYDKAKNTVYIGNEGPYVDFKEMVKIQQSEVPEEAPTDADTDDARDGTERRPDSPGSTLPGKRRKKGARKRSPGVRRPSNWQQAGRQIKYSKYIREAALRYRVPISIIRGVIKTESNFNPKAVSRKGAEGLMQLMPGTARMLGVTDPFDPQQNIFAGTRYLRTLINQFGGKITLVLAAYAAGPGKVSRAATEGTKGGIPPGVEGYVRKVLTLACKYAQPGGTDGGNTNLQFNFDKLCQDPKAKKFRGGR